MKRLQGTLVPLIFFLLIFVAACSREKSVASKSADAYRTATAQGKSVAGGHDHGGHVTETSTSTAVDHSAHGVTADPHAGMDHGSAGSSSPDHAAMGHGTASPSHAGHGSTAVGTSGHDGHRASAAHSSMGHGSGSPAGEQHAGHSQQPGSAPMDHSQHGGSAPTPARPEVAPHAQHGAAPAPDVGNIELSSTLRGDTFDAPAPIAVSEAAKAGQSSGHAGHQMRGITPGEDRENAPTPMPATRDGRQVAPSADHGGHGPASTTREPAASYTCPMHPEVISDKPGTCPKCGMALVKKN